MPSPQRIGRYRPDAFGGLAGFCRVRVVVSGLGIAHAGCMNIEMKNIHLAPLIREEREKRNLTQEHLAELAEVSARTVQRLEAHGAYSKETLMAVAEAFDVDSRELIKAANERAEKGKQTVEELFLVLRLVRRRTGRALLAEIANGDGMRVDYPEQMTLEQTEAAGHLLDFIRDFADFHDDLEPSEGLRYDQTVSEQLAGLEKIGLAMYTGAYLSKRNFENGKTWTMRVNIVLVTSISDARIVRLSGSEEFINGALPRGAANSRHL
jgi:transcriptional regulator with XRE-family HTH domain